MSIPWQYEELLTGVLHVCFLPYFLVEVSLRLECESTAPFASQDFSYIYSYKMIYNDDYTLLYLSKTTRQHHRNNTKGSEKSTTTPRPKHKDKQHQTKTTGYTTRFCLALDVRSGLG